MFPNNTTGVLGLSACVSSHQLIGRFIWSEGGSKMQPDVMMRSCGIWVLIRFIKGEFKGKGVLSVLENISDSEGESK